MLSLKCVICGAVTTNRLCSVRICEKCIISSVLYNDYNFLESGDIEKLKNELDRLKNGIGNK